jgi:pimeloyl-ACP methyl ester carboxylesterase
MGGNHQILPPSCPASIPLRTFYRQVTFGVFAKRSRFVELDLNAMQSKVTKLIHVCVGDITAFALSQNRTIHPVLAILMLEQHLTLVLLQEIDAKPRRYLMDTTTKSEEINQHRRSFLGTAAVTVAATQFLLKGSAEAQPSKTKPAGMRAIKPGTNTSFASLKQIDAGLLNVGYAEAGPSDGPVVILLHGWPYDIHSFVDVAPQLASAGYRVIVPYVRGYGTTRFLSSETFRNGQQAAVALDTLALMDSLKIEKATLAGFDWGARTADIIAALWPERCKALVSVSGYLIGSPSMAPLPPKAEFAWWYQYYFATENGRAGYDKYRRDFAKLIWQLASPKWDFDDATFDRTAASFDNPDHVAIVIHNYRWRIGLAKGEPKYDDLDKRLAESPAITVPTITLEGDANGAPHPEAGAYAKKFTGKYAHRVIKGGVGHNLPQEAPQAFVEAIVDVAET